MGFRQTHARLHPVVITRLQYALVGADEGNIIQRLIGKFVFCREKCLDVYQWRKKNDANFTFTVLHRHVWLQYADNTALRAILEKSFWFQLILSAVYSVDTFFCLGYTLLIFCFFIFVCLPSYT